MDPTIPYLACVLGAVALYLLLRPGKAALKAAGAVLGLGALAWIFASLVQWFSGTYGAISGQRQAFFAIFSLIALACAVRMITHSRPVYSALYFVMVVLSSAGLFLLLEAEFMAFALIIVYAGAILITYMFVLMLAQQAQDVSHPEAAPEYDRVPREPGYAAAVGFIMLVLLTTMALQGGSQLASRPHEVSYFPAQLQAAVEELSPGAQIAPGAAPIIRDGVVTLAVIEPGASQLTELVLPREALPSNIQAVGLDLVWKFPVSLELAGVILLLAMFGAVVLARKQIELGEDEVREAAGMRRLGLHGTEEPARTRTPAAAGNGART